ESVRAYEPMELLLHRVSDKQTGNPFTPDRSAEVLLLGDSFTQVFSDPRLEMGEHAGFAEHLAKELNAPLDVIALAGGSARAVRESLARRPEGLSGKKLVIWQISIRDFNGDPSKWEQVLFPQGTKSAEGPRAAVRVRAELVEVTRVPAEFDYEFCLAVHEYRLLEALDGTPPPGPIWVAHVALDDFEATPQAAYEVGAEHTLFLDDVALHHNLETTSWLDATGADPRATIWFPTTPTESDARRREWAVLKAELESAPDGFPTTQLSSEPSGNRSYAKGLELARADSILALQQRIFQIRQHGYSDELLEACVSRLEHNATRTWFPMDGWSPARNELNLVRILNTPPPARHIKDRPIRDTRRTIRSMAVILEYHNELKARGIDLLVVPIPGRVQAWSDRALGVPPFDPIHGGDVGLPELLLKMTSEGINVVDVFPALACARAAAMAAGDPDPDLFLTHNTHWSPQGVEACTAPIAEWVRSMKWFEQGPAKEGTAFFRRTEVITDPSKMYGPGRGAPRELIYPKIVSRKGERPYRLSQDFVRGSPVLLIGDSFSSYHWESFADMSLQLFAELGHPVDVISLSQGAENAVWNSVARRGDNLEGKKVVIWLFSANVLVSMEMTKVEIFTD
ncbi:MAG: hypothetical protein P8N31_04765, partial [Planctomycetota bacterium]|nr:hypothetical protein [Planctomycetota bacterium]